MSFIPTDITTLFEKKYGFEPKEVFPLTPEGSQREYFRVKYGGQAPAIRAAKEFLGQKLQFVDFVCERLLFPDSQPGRSGERGPQHDDPPRIEVIRILLQGSCRFEYVADIGNPRIVGHLILVYVN